MESNIKTQTDQNPDGFPNGDHKQYCGCAFCQWQDKVKRELKYVNEQLDKMTDKQRHHNLSHQIIMYFSGQIP